MLAYVESVSAARTLAQANGYEIDARQELLGLGAANLAAGFFQAYPVAGGLSQSSVNDKAGAKTPLALVFASIAIGLCLMFLTGLLANLPNVVLAAIVLVAVKGLVNVGELRHVWRVSRFEFAISMVAFAAVLMLGILKGVIVAVLISMLLIIRRAAHPRVWRSAARVPGTRIFSDIGRHAENEAIPHVLAVRVEASLLYFNVEHVRETIWWKIRTASEPVGLLICDLSASPVVDLRRRADAEDIARNASGLRHGDGKSWPHTRTCGTCFAPKGLPKIVWATSVRRDSVADAVDEFQSHRGVGDGPDVAPRATT